MIFVVVVVLLLLPWISAGVTPVFILSYIRLTVLRESILSYRKCLSDVELVVCDFGSEFEPLLAYFNLLEKQEGVTIYRYKNKLQHWKDLDPMINYSVRRWYEENKSRLERKN